MKIIEFIKTLGLLIGGLMLPKISFSKMNSRVIQLKSPFFNIKYKRSGESFDEDMTYYTYEMSLDKILSEYKDNQILLLHKGT